MPPATTQRDQQDVTSNSGAPSRALVWIANISRRQITTRRIVGHVFVALLFGMGALFVGEVIVRWISALAALANLSTAFTLFERKGFIEFMEARGIQWGEKKAAEPGATDNPDGA